MITYHYDGTFEGLLTVMATAMAQNDEVNEITAQDDWQPDLFTELRHLETNPTTAEEFFTKCKKQFSKPVVLDIGKCFLSEESGIEKVLLDFIRLLFAYGEPIACNLANPTVMRVRKTSDQVSYEILRMQGFVRFRKLPNQYYYAAIEPDHNIVQFLAPHFTARFADQLWLIHDVKRQSGICYNRERCLFIPQVAINPDIISASRSNSFGEAHNLFAAEEYGYQQLWNQYFQEIAILERINPKLQRKNMPARYWSYLVEQVR
ncbi:MAG TPA: TIGR03915 family putative DNA repair protein [Bacillota bacterium]|nr:TIGR03915 family putative DNA repair protein [Bacillota bacterium]